MLKLLHYAGEDESGPRSHIITPGEPELVKTAAPLHHEVQQFIAHLKPRDGKTYALVNALGATELYGPNINADGFSIDALRYKPDGWDDIPPWEVEARRALAAKAPYGFTTFYDAGAFRHHKNKPYAPHNHPQYGVVDLAVWHEAMRRVELVVALDHDLCRKAGGWDIVEKLEAGEYLPVSMGCRVKYDTCSLCGQKSKTRNDYCHHMNKQDPRFKPNLILPDGRQIFVWNPYPRFFDISFVLIGADKTAKVMGLLSSGKQSFISVPPQSLSDRSADRAADLGYTDGAVEKVASPEEELLALLQEDEMEKVAHQKVAVEQKLADIIKELPPDRAAGKAMPLLERVEPDIPSGILDSLSKPRGSVADDLGSIAATAGKLGIVLKPREFQHLVLSRCGNGALANELGARNQVFSPCLGTSPFSMGSPLPDLHRLLHPFLATRSMMGAPLKKRITIVISVTPPPPRNEVRSTMPLLDEISRSYNGYRHSLLRFLAGGGCDSLSHLHQEASDPLAKLFTRNPVAITDDSLAGLFSLGPLMYLLRAYWDATKHLGPEVSQRIAAENPGLVAKLAYANPA